MPIFHNRDPLPSINPGEFHIACMLLVDTSGSMSGNPIAELNQGLVEFGDALKQDSLALGRAEVSVIAFNSSVDTEVGFRPASDYEAPVLRANGLTSMNEAIEAGLDALEARKAEYRANGIRYYRPWLFLLTDGAPTDGAKESSAKARLRSAIQNKKVVYMPMGIGTGADIAKLQSYYPEDATARPVLKASASNFKEAFVWLSASIAEVSHSNPDAVTEVQTPPTPSCITIGI
jgi:uncharacterized protein YegL